MSLKYLTHSAPFFLICGVLVSGCVTTKSRSGRYRSTSPMVSSTLRRHDEQITSLTFQSNQFKERESDIVRSLNSLNKRVAVLAAENVALKKKLAALSQFVQNEKIARKAESDALLKEIATQTASALSAASKARAAALANSTNTHRTLTRGPAMKGAFYVYEVERGATLGAIAKAYKVSVSDIKKANHLRSDTIHIGQKLYIPKK